MNRRLTCMLLVALIVYLAPVSSRGADVGREAAEILAATGVQGGLVVHLNCGDGKLAAALGGHERLVVHGLAETVESVAVARALTAVRKHAPGTPELEEATAGQGTCGGLDFVVLQLNALIVVENALDVRAIVFEPDQHLQQLQRGLREHTELLRNRLLVLQKL